MYVNLCVQSQPDGWVARLGVFGRLHELSMYKAGAGGAGGAAGAVGALGSAAVTAKLLAMLLKVAINPEEKFDE